MRSDGGGRRAARGARVVRVACGRCFGHADHAVGQHQCGGDDGGGKGRRHDSRGRGGVLAAAVLPLSAVRGGGAALRI